MVSLMEICQRIFELRASLNVGHHGPTFSFVFRTILLLEAETRLWQIWIFLKSFVFNYYFLTTQQQIDWDQAHSLNAGPKSGHWSLETLVTGSECHPMTLDIRHLGDHNVTMWRWTFVWSIPNMIPQIKICSNCRKQEVRDRSANCYQGMLIQWRVPTSNILQSFNQIENGSKDCSRSKQLQEMEGELNSNKQYEIMKIEK